MTKHIVQNSQNTNKYIHKTKIFLLFISGYLLIFLNHELLQILREKTYSPFILQKSNLKTETNSFPFK